MVRENISAGRFSQISRSLDLKTINSVLLCLLFVVLSVAVLSFEMIQQGRYLEIIPVALMVIGVCVAAVFYIYHYQRRIITNNARISALIGLCILLLVVAKLSFLLTYHTSWAIATSVIAAIILTIAYDQRFAIGMSILYSVLGCFTAMPMADINLLLTMMAGIVVCCFSLREIRTRMKLLEVGALTAGTVLLTSVALGFLAGSSQTGVVFKDAGYNAIAALVASLFIQSILPVIEKVFGIATSMTLLDYSDASQPLLKKLQMEAPGTFSHSLLVGSIAEAAAESIGCNGLLCRVGAYYHDIGKINKPSYFVENELGSSSRHKELSPAMSQLIIVGHVKDGVEMAKEFSLPSVLRQFIESHHGTTLVEYFYHEAKKKQNSKSGKEAAPSESEFRYAGPKPHTKEAAIVMLADSVEGAIRSMPETTPKKIENLVHNIAMKRLQDGQFDECELSLRELSQIEASTSKALAGHYHGRIAYPGQSDGSEETSTQKKSETPGEEQPKTSPEPTDQKSR